MLAHLTHPGIQIHFKKMGGGGGGGSAITVGVGETVQYVMY